MINQEQIYAEKGVGQAKVDVVLNSWMPTDLDFTREIRMLNAPAIIYARSKSGSTGVDYPGENPVNLGKESSYSTGPNYYDVSQWEGIATSGVTSYKYGYFGGSANVSQIHIHENVIILDEELEIPNPSEDEKYVWEESLKELFGRQRMEDKHFY